MAKIRHMAMCTKNNRRLARFYRSVFGLEELWSDKQNSPYSFYTSDGYINLNILQIRTGMSMREKSMGIEFCRKWKSTISGTKLTIRRRLKRGLRNWTHPAK